MSRDDERHRAREAALQMLYQWEIGGGAIDEVIDTYLTHGGSEIAPKSPELATTLARGTAEHLPSLDPIITAATDNWRLSRMAVLDRLILRLAVFEFLHMPSTPRRVVIDEALELAKTFSADESVAFINGVLDGVLRGLDQDRDQIADAQSASLESPNPDTTNPHTTNPRATNPQSPTPTPEKLH